jgi:hypothetical protein
MSRSHVLLHCGGGNLAKARNQAWGAVRPGNIWVLLANPRWESRLLHFLNLSGVGRVVENGKDEEECWAARMDDWIAWEHRDGGVG